MWGSVGLCGVLWGSGGSVSSCGVLEVLWGSERVLLLLAGSGRIWATLLYMHASAWEPFLT